MAGAIFVFSPTPTRAAIAAGETYVHAQPYQISALVRRPASFAASHGNTSGKKDGDDDKKSYSQAELDAMFTDRAKRAADKATADMLAALGVKDADEAKAKLKTAKDAEDARLSELDKAKKDADEATAALAKAKADGKWSFLARNIGRPFAANCPLLNCVGCVACVLVCF